MNAACSKHESMPDMTCLLRRQIRRLPGVYSSAARILDIDLLISTYLLDILTMLLLSYVLLAALPYALWYLTLLGLVHHISVLRDYTKYAFSYFANCIAFYHSIDLTS